MARKGRSDSKLDQLEPEVRQDLIDKFLHENLGLTAAREWLADTHEVSIAISGLHSWFHRVVWPLKLKMREQYATMANALVSEARGKEVNWTEALEEKVAQRAYEMLETGANEKQALAYAKTAFAEEKAAHDQKMDKAKLEQSQEKLEQDERRLKLLEQKAAAADMAAEQMQKLKDGGDMLPEEERAAILLKVDEILNIKK